MGYNRRRVFSISQDDLDEINLVDYADTDFSHEFTIEVDDSYDYTLLSPKIGDLRIQDPDDVDDSDYIQFTTDDASGSSIQNTSLITSGSVSKIDASGTIVADSDIYYHYIDLEHVEVNDGANTPQLITHVSDFSSVTETEVDGSYAIGHWVKPPATPRSWASYVGFASSDQFSAAANFATYLDYNSALGSFGLYMTGVDVDSRNWIDMSPGTATVTGDYDHNFINLDLGNWTIDNAGFTPEIRLFKADLSGITETGIGHTTLYGIDWDFPDITGYNTGAVMDLDVNSGDLNVQILPKTNEHIKLSGTSVDGKRWIEIAPSGTHNAGNEITLIRNNLDNFTIDDGGSGTVLTGIVTRFGSITETTIGNTTITGHQVMMPPTRSGYLMATGMYIGDGLGGDFAIYLDLAGSSVGTQYGIYMYGSDIVERHWCYMSPTGTLNAANTLTFYELDMSSFTINDGGNAAVMRGLYIDASGMTETDYDHSTWENVIKMPSTAGGYSSAVGLRVEAPSGRAPAIDANNKGTDSGRIEQGAYFFEDHFWGREAKSVWTTRVTSGGVGGAPSSTDLNGVYELLTGGAGADEESLDWNDIFTFSNTLHPTFEVRVNLAQVDNDTNVFLGLVNTNIAADLSEDLGGGNEDLIGFAMTHNDYTNTNWHLHSQLDGVSTNDEGSAAGASTWVTLRFEFITDTSVEWFIDGSSQGTVSSNIPTDDLQPVLYIMTDVATPKSMDVDYVRVWADRE